MMTKNKDEIPSYIVLTLVFLQLGSGPDTGTLAFFKAARPARDALMIASDNKSIGLGLKDFLA
jgi:hypothetical protein